MGRKSKDFSRLEGESIKPFLAAIKSPATAEVYQRRLVTFLEHVDMDVDGFVAVAKKNPRWAQDIVLKFCLQ